MELDFLPDESLVSEDVLLDKGNFVFVGRIRVVPLPVIRKAVAERPVACNLPVMAKTSGGHEGGSEVDDFKETVHIHDKIHDGTRLFEVHAIV